MASITIRNMEEPLKSKLRLRAAQHGRSMEDEVRDILRVVLAQEVPGGANLADAIRRRFAPLGGIDLVHQPRDAIREPPRFDE